MRALLLAAAVAAPVHLTIAPWTTPPLPTATHAALTLRLTVSGRPAQRVRLRATGVANGWLAAFCTSRLCSPQSVDVMLPSSGHATYEFELIRQDPNGPHRSGAHIAGDDGSSVDVAPVSSP